MPSAVPTLPEIDVSEPDKVIEAIRKTGCCVIKNSTTPDLVDQVNAETRPYLDDDKPWKVNTTPFRILKAEPVTSLARVAVKPIYSLTSSSILSHHASPCHIQAPSKTNKLFHQQGDLFPPQTRRCTRLISRSPTARTTWHTHSILNLLTADSSTK